MKKIFVVLSLAILISGCAILNPPDTEAIKKMMTEDMTVTVEPKDEGADIIIANVPEELPHGLESIDIYIDKEDMEGKSVDDLDAPVAEDVAGDITIEVTDLENGVETYVGGVGNLIGGQDTDAYGFGGGFYPRPGGTGTFLGGPGDDGSESEWIIFDRTTGEPTAGEQSSQDNDFFFYTEGTQIYIVAVHNEAGVAVHEDDADDWLDVKDAPESYGTAVPIAEGDICHFKTHDDYYGKFQITEALTPLIMEGEVNIDLKYAFQTNQHVGHY